MHAISAERIADAAAIIDPAFLNTPQYLHEPLGRQLGCRVFVKLETLNPIRCFKGRGACAYMMQVPQGGTVVCASVGNFGQGLAYAGRKRNTKVVIYAAENANQFKLQRMRELGAEVRLAGHDFDAAKAAAAEFSQESGACYAIDGKDTAIAEGAGTMAVELTRHDESFDAVVIPLGNGSLITGVGAWLRAKSPKTKIIGVCASGAPSMERSWRSKQLVTTDRVRTIAEGIAVRVPVPEALELMKYCVDDILLVDDNALLDAARLIHSEVGVVVEPTGAVAVAAVMEHPSVFRKQLVALPLCGANVSKQQLEEIFNPGTHCCA